MIIGLSGRAGAGKDTVADFLAEGKYIKTSLADPMKHICKQVFGFTDKQLWGPSQYRNEVDPRWGFSPRKALQTLGTGWGRALHEDTWIRVLVAQTEGRAWSTVVPDVRFQNEMAVIRAAGGEVWRIVRPGYEGLTGAEAAHASENDIQEGDCDRILLNDGSLDKLRKTVAAVRL